MNAFKNTSFFLVFMLIITLLPSCVSNIFDAECGEDKILDTLTFADSTKDNYSKWTGRETIIFKDSLGNEEIFTPQRGKNISFNNPLVIKTLCNASPLNRQTEHYMTEMHWVDFSSQNSGFFRLMLRTDTIQQKADVILYDIFSVHYGTATFYMASPRANEKSISANSVRWYEDYVPNFVADTTIFGKNFKDVYFATGNTQSAIYFQKTNMIIGYKLAGKTWLLDRIQ